MAKLAEAQRRKRRVQAGVGGALALIVLVLGTTWLLGGFDSADEPVTLPTCSWTERAVTDDVTDTGLPPSDVPTSGVNELVLTTNLGEIHALVDLSSGYCGAASVGFLAGLGFYNNTRCDRLDTNLRVLTCGGDKTPNYHGPVEGTPRMPLGTASPAPDVTANPDADTSSYYAKGAVLLDNLDVNAISSKIMIVYDDNTPLEPRYTQIGTVSSGLEFVTQVAAGGATDATGAASPVGTPNLDLTFTSVRMTTFPASLTSDTPTVSAT